MARLISFDNKYKKVLFGIMFLFIFLVISAIFFSNFKFTKKDRVETAIVNNEGDLTINYVNGQDLYCDDECSYVLSINSNAKEQLFYSIKLENLKVKGKVEVTLLDEKDNVLYQDKIKNSEEMLFSLKKIAPDEVLRYKIVVKADKRSWIEGTILAINESESSKTFGDIILLNNTLSTNMTMVGSETANENEGLIASQDDNGTSYYFRGNVENNYVNINNTLFRIVRINGSGSVRLVLNDVLENKAKYSANASDVLFDNSAIKNTLNDWLNKNFEQYMDYFVEDDFCIDTSFGNYMNNINYANTQDRIFTLKAPSLSCNGTRYESKVGLLTIDEVVMAGALKNKNNTNYYLYNPSIQGDYMTMSTYFINNDNEVILLNIKNDGSIGEGIKASDGSLIRPVVNISTNVKVSGSGMKGDPYIILS